MLTHTAALRERCAVLVAVNGRKEDELLRLEGERIDQRSALEKALLQGSRRNQRGGAMTSLAGGSSDALDAPGEIEELKASLSAAERAVKDARWGAHFSSPFKFLSPLFFFPKYNFSKIPILSPSLICSTSIPIRPLAPRRAMRAWYRDVRKLASDLAPELFSLIPDLQSPGSVLGDGGFADYAKVPHR